MEEKKRIKRENRIKDGFWGELREKSNAWEDKFWQENESASRQEVERIPPTIIEAGDA